MTVRYTQIMDFTRILRELDIYHDARGLDFCLRFIYVLKELDDEQ